MDVMQAGEKRVVLLTDRDVALLRVKFVALRSTFKPLWFVHLAKIQTVRGEQNCNLKKPYAMCSEEASALSRL